MARYLGQQSRSRELAIQLALQERIRVKFQRLLVSNISGTMRQAVAAFVRDGSDIALEGVVASRRQGLEVILANEWRIAAKTFGDRILETVTKGRNFERKDATSDYFEEAIRQYIKTWAADAAKDISLTTARQIRTMILEGVDEGLGTEAIGRMIRERIPFMSTLRANTIARTETHSAAAFGAQMAAEATELPLRKEWISTNDDRTREDGWDHVSLDGTIVGLHEKFEVTNNETGETEELEFPGDPSGSAGNIINCFSGETKVSFDSLKKSIRSIYNGELITIKTAAGYELTGTPNHPVMTDAGFIRLDEINNSTNLLCCQLGVNLTDGLDVYNVPTTFEQVHNTLSVIGVGVGVAGVPVNLYGRIANSNVNVVGAESLLRGADVSEFLKLCNKHSFASARFAKTTLFGNGLLNSEGFMKFRRLVSYGFVGFGNLLNAITRWNLRPFNTLGLGLIANGNTVLNQDAANNISAGVKSLRDFVFAKKLVTVQRPDAVRAKLNDVRANGNTKSFESFNDSARVHAKVFGDFVATKSRFVHTDKVVFVERKFVHNHMVYTLETLEGLYNAGGVISSNCRCVVAYLEAE